MKHDLADKLYYTIGEVAKAFDVNSSLIRFWEKEFDEIQPKKNAKGNRKFTRQDVKTIDLIYHLVKERGFTLEGAKTHLREDKKETLSKFELISKLKAIKSELISIKNQL
ncbi:MerR family transcriptional regulator [Psychroflexus gondwanensis]|jgi:DNA-binding transcriptional MerR regulator|uniref:Transcriptional regulator, MerR superfamily protein n=1 Tax=Psychroflexus gondwanensis ACAM 44 TaxID=1189619 RepID=N1WSN4_9FLAO|nr:MerR family transcriptional regulator [Psychroflexus gondwanensis]EMY81985.1 transcriptional regulator, MerR superfamily protein [Psychroflexus gondwanensis ACAM 44]TXE20474.1 MerR family transcriptional regulator [Psychroflexus gondwanensis]